MPEGLELPCCGRRPRPSRRVVAIRKMIVEIEKLTPGGSNGDVLGHMPEPFGALYQSAYEAGYRQGFRDGFTDGVELRKKDNGRAAITQAPAKQTRRRIQGRGFLACHVRIVNACSTATCRIVRAARLRK